MQNGPEQVCNDETGEVAELLRDRVGFDVILVCEDAVYLVFCDDTEKLMQKISAQDGDADVGGMLELLEDATELEVVEIACVVGGEPVNWDDTEPLMHCKFEHVGEADVVGALELIDLVVGVDGVGADCVDAVGPVCWEDMDGEEDVGEIPEVAGVAELV